MREDVFAQDRISTKERSVRGLTRGQKVALLIGVTLLGLANASCARVQSHYVLPQLAVADPSFLPTVEAYTSAALGGNTVDLLLNGDEIFPAMQPVLLPAPAAAARPAIGAS